MQSKVIVLAAGHGKRMESKIPKALMPLGGMPIISHLLDAVEKSGLDDKPAIVVSERNEKQIESAVGKDYAFIVQKEQLGTGHAVLCAKEYFQNEAVDNVLVLYSDHPFVSADTIQKIMSAHINNESTLTMATIKVDDFLAWRQPLQDFGRIVRDSGGKIIEIVEKKDSTKEQLEIKEINPSYFCFKAGWLWENLPNLKAHNAQREYYLVDLIKLAIQAGVSILDIKIGAREGIGVNSQEHLNLVRELLVNTV